MGQRRSWSEAYSDEHGRHAVAVDSLPGWIPGEQPGNRMRRRHHDRIRTVFSDHVLPAVGQVADPEIPTEDLRAIDLDPAVDEDPATVGVELPHEIAAVVVV